MCSVLLIGPRHSEKARTIGGATLLFEELIDHIVTTDDELITKVISTNKYSNRLFSFLYIIQKVSRNLRDTDIIVLNANQAGVRFLWPLLVLIGSLKKIKIALRCFGSDFNDVTKFFGSKIQILLRGTDVIFFETKALVDHWKTRHSNIKWMPNCRKPMDLGLKPKSPSVECRLVYIGRVTKSKGIQELLLAMNDLGPEVRLSIYGPVEKDLAHIRSNKLYGGELTPDLVSDVLANNDILILPTYYEGEGYPGVIVEAFRQGVPVIGTLWGGISEMIEDGKTGVLMQPRSVLEIKNAVFRILSMDYAELAHNCLCEFEKYDSQINHEFFINQIRNLCVE